MAITVTIAQLPSTSASAQVWEGEAGTSVGDILSAKGIDGDGKVLKFNSVEVSSSSAINSDGMLTVTQGAKGNS